MVTAGCWCRSAGADGLRRVLPARQAVRHPQQEAEPDHDHRLLQAALRERALVVLISVGVLVLLVAYMAPQFVAGARLLQAVSGVDYTTLLVIFAGVVLVYIGLGGFLASALTDALQGILMFFGGIAVWIALLTAAGGLGGVNTQVMDTKPELFTLPGPGGFTLSMIMSYSLQLGLMICVLPHLAVRAMSYKDSKSVHTAMMVGPIIMVVITLGFLTMGLVSHQFHPNMEVGDLALPRTVVDVLPDGIAGIVLAAPLAAAMSTVDSMILIVSGVVVRDLFTNFVNPRVSDGTAKRMASGASIVIGLVVLLLALEPPNYLEYLVIYAIGGLEVVLFVPLLGGLYSKRGNALGVVLAMVGGAGWYVVANEWVPDLAFGMFPIASSSLVSVLGYVVGSAGGRPPRREVLVKFWGTQAEIDRLSA
ncbi:MAG: sodium/panthothenate symporter [Streptosporangiales bacterium]|nr:sodium/panthothenate symporter [Streptosporangiales bacterium]